jgi:hypothetical protein
LTNHWKQVAWNGVRFKTPAEWELARIGSRHLILEDETGPVMEIKWGPVKGTFSHEVQLRRLAASKPRRLKGGIAEWYLPPHWQAALSDFETSGFLWQGEAAIGRGVILFCPACRNAALIQFFRYSTSKRERVLSAVLRSYRDHRQDGHLLWSVFDIRATLPEELKLAKFRFDAGKFEMGFICRRQSVYLHRWAPAAALIGGGDLISFAQTIPEFSTGPPQALTMDGRAAVEWRISPVNDWQRKMSRLKVRPSYFWYRLWHVAEKNRILGLRAESKYPLDFQLLDRIYLSFEIF